MTIAWVLARWALAAVFAVAGVAKLFDLPGSGEALREFGLPDPIAHLGRVALPLLELVVAAALLPASTARWGAVGALLLLSVFAFAIARTLAAGRRPECHCFGQLHSAPAGVGTLVRDLALAVAAAFVAVGGAPHGEPAALAWLGRLSGDQIAVAVAGSVLTAAVAFLGCFCFQLLRENGRLLKRVEAIEQQLAGATTRRAGLAEGASLGNGSGQRDRAGPSVGSRAPAVALPGLDGRTRSLEELRSGLPALIVFSDPACGPCGALLPEIALWQREYGERMSVVVVTRGTAKANRANALEHGLGSVLLQEDREVSKAFDALATPSAVLVSEDGLIASSAVRGADAIRGLFAEALIVRQPTEDPKGLPIGARAPDFRLATLDRRTISLRDYRGSQTIVLFWHPGCGFCQRLLPDVKAWESSAADPRPQLIVVSSGTVDENRALGLHSPIVLDDAFETGRRFGATGTPSAALIDADGVIASSLAVGGPAVLKLATRILQSRQTTPQHRDGVDLLRAGMAATDAR